MPHKLTLSALLFLLVTMTACGQRKPDVSERFFVFLNAYQKDSLQNILTDDFQLKRSFTTYSNDKTSFLETYVSFSKACNGKYKILKVLSDVEPKQFLVEDHSDYLKYLHVAYPTWKFTISTQGNKILLISIDTTETFKKYTEEMSSADKKFKSWLKLNYPEVTQEMLFAQEGLLIKCLKAYEKKGK